MPNPRTPARGNSGRIRGPIPATANTPQMQYQILNTTRNSGQYVAGPTAASMDKAKAIVRAARAPRKTYWQVEGEDVAAYAAREDMIDEDRAVARIRPVSV